MQWTRDTHRLTQEQDTHTRVNDLRVAVEIRRVDVDAGRVEQFREKVWRTVTPRSPMQCRVTLTKQNNNETMISKTGVGGEGTMCIGSVQNVSRQRAGQ